MEYQVKRFKDANMLPRVDENGQYGIDMFVWTGVVNNPYEMVILDSIFCPLELTDTPPQMAVKMEQYAIQFSANKYPNT